MSRLTTVTHFDLDKAVKKMPKARIVTVGFPNTGKAMVKDKDGVTALYKATVNNYGIGVPARPFMMKSFKDNKEKYAKFFKSLRIDKDIDKQFGRLGLMAVGHVQKSIRDGGWVGNSQATIDAKGSSKPLVDTGNMIQSVDYQIK